MCQRIYISYLNKIMNNPTPNSNYLIDHHMMINESQGLISNNIDKLLKTGRNVFVNLTTSEEIRTLYNYVPHLKELVSDAIFINYPIPDYSIPDDSNSFRHLIVRLDYVVRAIY